MSNSRKQILSRLMGLDNPKVDKLLVKFARDIFIDIQKSEDNESILEDLDLVNEFVYKIPKEAIKIINYIFEKKPIPPTVNKSAFGTFKGKSHEDLMLKSFELLDHIRYIVPNDVLKITAELSLHEDLKVRNKALEIVKKLSQYNYNVLTKSKIGYGAQAKTLEFIQGWSIEVQLSNFDFVEIVTKELLSSSIEGSEWTAMDKLTFHSAAVSPTEFLKKLRREIIQLLGKLYHQSKDEKIQLRIVRVLEEVSRGPDHTETEDVTKMITEDSEYLIEVYRRMLFDKDGHLVGPISVAKAIESRFYWLFRNKQFKTPEAEKLRADILIDKFYALFRLLIADPSTYNDEEGWDNGDKNREEKIESILRNITEESFDQWLNDLNRIAKEFGIVDEWQFNIFRRFLIKLAKKFPDFAHRLLQNSYKNELPLPIFVENILTGFRSIGRLDLWDEYYKQAVETKDKDLTRGLVVSLFINEPVELNKKVREKDTQILEDITKNKGHFAFLAKYENWAFHADLFRILVNLFARAPWRFEILIRIEIEGHPSLSRVYFDELQFAVWGGWVSVDKLSAEMVAFLKQKLIEIPDLDWHMQELLFKLSQNNISFALDVFRERIKYEEKQKEKHLLDAEVRYESIPYHFNPDLQKYLAEQPEFKVVMTKWVQKMTLEWSTYNWQVSHFIQRIGVPLVEIIAPLLKAGDDGNLIRAAHAIQSIESGPIDLCVQIAGRTNNKHILARLESMIHSTGVVSGEYGIAEAYERKAKDLKRYKNDKNPKIKKFVLMTIKSLNESAKRQRQHADEERELRRIEFEG